MNNSVFFTHGDFVASIARSCYCELLAAASCSSIFTIDKRCSLSSASAYTRHTSRADMTEGREVNCFKLFNR